eukprot:Nitzschia sp. Nitz4//scaffold199_size41809//40219//41322//NITZ4_007460-RA/size41809-processed-gene-0.63-mRNA-1//-1//CDS//3329540591//4062//frame0
MVYLRSLFVLLSIASCIEGAEPGKTLLAIGDSMVAGVTGIYNLVKVEGFVEVLYDELQANYSFDTLANSACPGETTTNFLFPLGPDPNNTECSVTLDRWPSLCYSGFCPADAFPRGLEGDSQMEAVEDYLADHPNEVGLIVLAIGANDLIFCDASNFVTCVPSAFEAISSNLVEIMTRLAVAAPDIPVVGYWYHNPFLAFYLPNGDAAIAAAYDQLIYSGNTLLEGVYEEFGVYVANGYTAINGYDQSGDPRQDVVNTCLYTGMCEMVDGEWTVLENYDYHPNEAGYALIAMEYWNVIESNGLLMEDEHPTSTNAPTGAATNGTAPTTSPTESPTVSPTEGSASHRVVSMGWVSRSLVVLGLVMSRF